MATRSSSLWSQALWADCKQSSVDDRLWRRVSEMVGYLDGGGGGGEVALGADCTLSPLGPAPEAPADSPVKRLVCSPDLPVFPVPARPDSSTADKPYRCDACDASFDRKDAFKNHARCHRPKEGDDPYRCDYCGKTFAVPARLTRHYRTHTGEKPYQCEYCKKSFSVKENLSVHRRIHTKERPYKCEVCERAFEHSGKLHRHMRIHTGERPHKCGVCAKTFIQSGQLVIHMRTHTGEKPYVCKDCGKGFTCSKQLKVHNRTHTGEKPYSCDICGKSFGYNHVLKLHQVAHYGEKVYKCTICNETFTSKKTMENHIKSHSEPSGRGEEGGGAESSCASSTSDKENAKEAGEYEKRGLNTALLAAVAAATYQEPVLFEVTEPAVYLVPAPLGAMARPPELPPGAAQDEELLTPPVSPAHDKGELILPPRKRSKAILESMEHQREVPVVRYSSVIHYAGAS